jgi:hypothetical protein
LEPVADFAETHNVAVLLAPIVAGFSPGKVAVETTIELCAAFAVARKVTAFRFRQR